MFGETWTLSSGSTSITGLFITGLFITGLFITGLFSTNFITSLFREEFHNRIDPTIDDDIDIYSIWLSRCTIIKLKLKKVS